MAKSKSLSQDDERDLRWFFREASGDLGLHGVNLEPQIGGNGDAQAGVLEHLTRAIPVVERWRVIYGRLILLRPDQRAVLSLVFGLPHFWAPYSEFGELAPLVELTATAIRRGMQAAEKRHPKSVAPIRVDSTDVRRAVERILSPKARDRVAIQAIRNEALALFRDAGTAYVRAQTSELKAWAGLA